MLFICERHRRLVRQARHSLRAPTIRLIGPMGNLYYSNSDAIIDDRLLHYIQVIAATKLRRGENFTLTLTQRANPEPRITIWMNPNIPLRFTYTTPEATPLVGAYLQQLAAQANSTSGLIIDLDHWTEPAPAQQAHAASR